MNALWWWIDRWRKSTAYTDMTLEQQGAYRNLLDEATLRGGALPNEDRILGKACGDAKAWSRLRAVVMRRFELQEDGWHNETLDSVLKQSERRKEKQARYRRGGGNESGNGSGNGLATTPVTNPVLRSPISGSVSTRETDPTTSTPSVPSSPSSPLITSPLQFEKAKKSFAFYGSRLKVPHVLHGELRDKLGGENPDAALQSWYLALNTEADETREAIPDVFVWLRPKFVAWVGIPVASGPRQAPRTDPWNQQQKTDEVRRLMATGLSREKAQKQVGW